MNHEPLTTVREAVLPAYWRLLVFQVRHQNKQAARGYQCGACGAMNSEA